MIPITRKELYLNKIVGNNEYEIPEKPISEEEFFFAEILGEAVQAPEPLTRYQMYLAKIAGRNIEIPYPEVRLEYFLAKAAGMNVSTPAPITKEEIYWSNYSAIVDFEIEGVPPLTYKAIEGTLENYRIYGDTVDGESVGDRTNNILPMSTTPIDTIIDDFHCEYDGMGTIKLTALTDNAVLSGFTVPLSKNFTIPISIGQGGTGCWQINNDAAYINVNNVASFCLYLKDDTQLRDNWALSVINRISSAYSAMGGANINAIQILTTVGAATNIQSGQTLTISPAFVENATVKVPFEPFGYKVPVTVSNGTDTLTTPIYLPAQISKVGDEAEYIDYSEQKQHRVRKNLLQNTATSQIVKGVTFTVNADGSITCSGILTSGEYADLVVSGVFLGDTDILENGNYVVSCANGSNDAYLLVGNSKGEVGRVRAAEINISANLTWAMLRIRQADPAITLYPMIRKADIEDDTYEPYIENTDIDVTLPALPTLTGTNVLSVGTTVQPSKVYIKGEKERD